MSNGLASIETLGSKDNTGEFQKTNRNGLALADQMQFSTLLKVMIAPPEKKLAEAQAQAKSLDHDDNVGATPGNGDALPIKVVENNPDRSSSRPETGREDSEIPEVSLRLDPADAKERSVRRDNQENRPDKPAVRDDSVARDDDSFANDSAVKKTEFAENVVAAAKSITDPQFLSGNAHSDLAQQVEAVVKTATASAAESKLKSTPAQANITSRTAATTLGSALTDESFADVPKELHAAVNREAKRVQAKVGNQTAASALAKHQQGDLTRRLGGLSQAPIFVNVTSESVKPQSAPLQTLTPGAVLADIAMADSESTNFSGQQKSRAGQTAPDRQGNLGNNGQSGERGLGQTVQQANNQNFGQAVRAQAMNAGMQNANDAANLGSKTTVAPDLNSLNAANGTNGPSQLSQTAKANPTTAARQPVPVRTPAEQIAVQIQKAIGAGADKINIRLHPAQLGRVEIKLEIGTDGQITAGITAERPETLDLLQRDARSLERALQDAGLRTNSDSLSFSLRDENAKPFELGKDRRDNHGGPPSERADTPEDKKDHGILNDRIIYGRNMAADGHVDIRV